MSTTANGTFEVKNWEEKPYNEMEGVAKLTHATVTQDYQGDIQGEGTLDYLMIYTTESAASFVGLERVVGRIGDRSGTFVIQHTGTFADGVASANYSVVPGSGTGDLKGLRGEGSYSTGHVQPHPFALDYSFE
jgi:Protein of unknown function (DUF3224)